MMRLEKFLTTTWLTNSLSMFTSHFTNKIKLKIKLFNHGTVPTDFLINVGKSVGKSLTMTPLLR